MSDPNPTPAPNTDPNPEPTPTPEPAPWYSDEQKDYVSNKGWKAPSEAIGAYQNLENLLGADRAGRTIVMPKGDDDKDGIAAFRKALGVPEKAEDYAIETPEGGDPAFAKSFAEKALELGTPMNQVQGFVEWWNEYCTNAIEAADKALEQQQAKELDELRAEWKDDFDQKAELGRRFAKELGLNADELNKLEEALGSKRFLQAFHTAGIKLAEPAPGGGDNSNRFGADGQKKALDELKQLNERRIAGTVSDKEFAAESERLGRIAYPDAAA